MKLFKGGTDMPETADSWRPPETQEALHAALAEIAKWEKEQNKLMIWDRITRLPFKLLDAVTPKIIHEKIGRLLDELAITSRMAATIWLPGVRWVRW
jgi:hypothetical protein